MGVQGLRTVAMIMMAMVARSAFILYESYTGYIPSYTYPVTFAAGDVINGTLSWPGAEDLDIYLYSSGMDLLDRSTRLDREYSPSLNPEILIYTIVTPGLYYLRVDLFSSVPTAYKFQILVNGVLTHQYYDTVITVTSGRTAKQFSTTTLCTVKIEYNGPIAPLYLFKPGIDVISGSPVASNTSNVNPKDLTATLTENGVWTIVIHHGLLSTTTLTPFTLDVYTVDTNQCENMCTSIAYATGLYPGRTDICLCEDGFSWDTGSSKCLIDCTQFDNAVSRAGDHACTCSGALVWNSTLLECVLDCSSIPSATALNDTDTSSCLCEENFSWEPSECVINCSALLHATSRVNQTSCACDPGYIWNSTEARCEIDCSGVGHSVGAADVENCACEQNYEWVVPANCVINCSMVEYADESGLGDNETCACEDGFFWVSVDSQCVINCSTIDYAVTRVAVDSCSCFSKYIWNSGALSCHIDCPIIADTIPPPISSTECNCTPDLSWNSDSLQCLACDESCTCEGYHEMGVGINSSNSSHPCSSVCGDGFVVYDEECDDGNVRDYDGCDSGCRVEEDFGCNGQPSQCTYSGDIDVSYVGYERVGCNSFRINLKLSPVLEQLYSNTDWIQLDQLLINSSSVTPTQSTYVSDGDLSITFGLSADLTEGQLSIINRLFGRDPSQIIIASFSPTIPALLYSEEECSANQGTLSVLVSSISWMSYGVLLGSLLCNKIIGLELFGVLQLAYFDLADHYDSINIYLQPFKGLFVSNGYNYGMGSQSELFPQQSQQFLSKIPPLMQSQLQINGYFINNYNVMFIVLFLCMFIPLGVYVWFGIKVQTIQERINDADVTETEREDLERERERYSKYRQNGEKFGKQSMITLVMFSLFQVTFCGVVFIKFCMQNQPQNSIAVALSVSLLVLISLITVASTLNLLWTGIEEKCYGQFKSSFMENPVYRSYIPISILYRMVIGVYISLQQEYEEGTLVVLFFSLVFMMVNFANLPFESALHNYRAGVIHVTQFIILLVANYYRSMKGNEDLEIKGRLHGAAIVQIVMVCTSVLISIAAVIYQLLKGVMNMSKEQEKGVQINENEEQSEKKEASKSEESGRQQSRRALSRGKNIHEAQQDMI